MSGGCDRCAGTVIQDVRSDGSSGNSPQRRDRRGKTRQSCAQVEAIALLSHIWVGIRDILPFSSQVVARPKRLIRHLVGAAVLVAAFIVPTLAAEITDVALVTGPQLFGLFVETAKKDVNVDAALRYYSERGFKANTSGLVQIRFRVADTKDSYRLFFIPVSASTTSSDKLQPVILSAQGPKGDKVLLGIIYAAEGKTLEVKDEQIATDGKIQQGHDQLKNLFKCSLAGCASAGAGCLLGGPEWLPCFCLWCGGSIVGCGVTELFFP
jgi:hypothetical protein